MRFRTEIERPRARFEIDHQRPVLLIGSCFTDEIGARLDDDGFTTVHNPLGPLYNPCSIARCLELAATGISESDLTAGPRGWHCLDFASKYSGEKDHVVTAVNQGLASIKNMLEQKPVVIITLGSAFVFRHLESQRIVGNCHKFPADCFGRELLTVEQASKALKKAIELLHAYGCCDIIFTVSPIRHLADGLHGNTVSKSTLQLAVDALEGVDYFPSYEIVLDDLRDYRFYAADMKHPSEVAVDYIYEIFSDTYFSKTTRAKALECRRASLASKHRSIL